MELGLVDYPPLTDHAQVLVHNICIPSYELSTGQRVRADVQPGTNWAIMEVHRLSQCHPQPTHPQPVTPRGLSIQATSMQSVLPNQGDECILALQALHRNMAEMMSVCMLLAGAAGGKTCFMRDCGVSVGSGLYLRMITTVLPRMLAWCSPTQ